MEIRFRGNNNTNSSSRDNIIPIAIVNHVVAGSGQSCDNWFRSSGNRVSSAHFCVWEDGTITQYVDLRRMAWANGLTPDRIRFSTSKLIRSRTANPNKYTISIEHAGHTGKLTDAQFKATVFLHRWIQQEVKRIFGTTIPLDREHVLGHYEIDPKRKPNCPGPDFPWGKLMSALQGEIEVGKKPATNPGQIGIATIKADVLNCRYADDVNSKVVSKLKKNTSWRVYAVGKWGYQVSTNGWIAKGSEYVDFEEVAPYVEVVKHIGIAEILVGKLNVRSGPSLKSPIVKEDGKNKALDKGSKWKVYAKKDGFYNVGGNQWISAGTKYVKLTSV